MILDTNILIYYLNGDVGVIRAVSNWREAGKIMCISPISVAETLVYPSLTPADVPNIRTFLNSFLSLPITNVIAETAALLSRKYRLALPDALIAATAMQTQMPLVTRDKQFGKITEIGVVAI